MIYIVFLEAMCDAITSNPADVDKKYLLHHLFPKIRNNKELEVLFCVFSRGFSAFRELSHLCSHFSCFLVFFSSLFVFSALFLVNFGYFFFF